MKDIFNFYLTLFVPFVVQVCLAMVLLTKKKLNFKFKAYISIPLAVLVAFGGPFLVTLIVAQFKTWNEFANIISYTAVIGLLYLAFFLLYKIHPMQLLLMLAVAHSFEHVSYQVSRMVLETGLNMVIYTNAGANNYNWISNLITYSTKAIKFDIQL